VFDIVSFGEWLFSSAAGLLGLVGVFGYSFLVAFILPMPGEVVLAMPINLGLSPLATLALVIGVSSLGKAIGSLAALRIGQRVNNFGLIETIRKHVLTRLYSVPFSVSLFSTVSTVFKQDSRLVTLIRRYGYVGLALALAVPLMPDTAVVYAFSAIKIDPIKFAAAAFIGTVLRLLAVVGLLELVLSIV
jgi:membrane protein YqaA with SNARE-associated domain